MNPTDNDNQLSDLGDATDHDQPEETRRPVLPEDHDPGVPQELPDCPPETPPSDASENGKRVPPPLVKEMNSSVASKSDQDASHQEVSAVVQPVVVWQPMAVTNQSQEHRAWLVPIWEVLMLILFPTLIVMACIISIVLLGLAQRSGWIVSAHGDGESSQSGMVSEVTATSYICPMMCVPPTTKPGRCPVCAMELVAASMSSSSGPSSKIQIDPRSRRVAGIQTVVAKSETLSREIRGVGEVSYDESKLKILSAYFDGRIEKLYADYTGITVKKGDSLALIYSPDLYAAQVGFARTQEFVENETESNSRTQGANRRLLESGRQRLVELGMTEEQIQKLERDGTPLSRLALHAPISGTVIEKMVVTGQYIKAGMPVYKLADLSSVWLVMELFPEDASLIEIGQPVTVTTQSMNGQSFEGTVEFVDPMVDPNTRTVGVRVAIDNERGHLRPGEFIRATMKVPLLSKDGEAQETVVVPRNSLLSVGQTSLVYVEGKPGEFEIRRVKTGPTVGGWVAILDGVAAGENVVSRSTFLLDAQMQLQGNPSLMDPDKAVMQESGEGELTEAEQEEIRLAMESLSESDRKLAEAQVICPVTGVRLGSMGMGIPIKVDVNGTPIFICCEGCRDGLLEDPEKNFKILEDYAAGKSDAGISKSQKPQLDLPEMNLPEMNLPQMNLPGK